MNLKEGKFTELVSNLDNKLRHLKTLVRLSFTEHYISFSKCLVQYW